MLIIGIVFSVLSQIRIKKGQAQSNTNPIFYRISLGIILYSLILSSQSWIIGSSSGGDIGILGGLFHTNNLINGIEMYIYLVSVILISLRPSPSAAKDDILLVPSSHVIVLFSLLGMILLICSYDLISIFLSIELQSLSLYIITTITKKEAIAAGLKYYLLGSLSSAILLLGLVLIYIITGVTQYDSLFLLGMWSSPWVEVSLHPLHLGVTLVMVGLLFKIGAAPFHNWAPDVYDGVPTIITSWIAIMGKISILIFISLWLPIISEFSSPIGSGMTILGVSTFLCLIIGSTLGLVQHKLKRLIAYSSISHLGFILLALTGYEGSWGITGLISFLFYMFQYWINLICIFAIIIYIARRGSVNGPYISSLQGSIGSSIPLVHLALIINLFSLAGIPPLIGFFGKQMVLYTGLLNGYYILAVIAILTSVISGAYYLKMVALMAGGVLKDRGSEVGSTFSSGPLSTTSLSTTSMIISSCTLIICTYMCNPVIILDFIHLLVLEL